LARPAWERVGLKGLILKKLGERKKFLGGITLVVRIMSSKNDNREFVD